MSLPRTTIVSGRQKKLYLWTLRREEEWMIYSKAMQMIAIMQDSARREVFG